MRFQGEFRVSVYDKNALTPSGNAYGHYVTQLETDKLSEAALFMEKQTESCCLGIRSVLGDPYRIVYFIHPPIVEV